ncbi:hypothetical protein CCZ01_01790 [Helicobacter monodelphidis]|uniref:AAA domain-containing protein n=1 Tax=Helicobacter sp. 15-1451 TaxID=2004995 RepID=UPI000DCBA59E|nr:AAA domain-containing protein [Helicobacter sp. 15-1451]RAX58948.1 hypothetical protein CCZ01_01790 [Helicobacter sp. 15-1451]
MSESVALYERLVDAASLYYVFLEENQRGLEALPVVKKQSNLDGVDLFLQTKYLFAEALVLQIGDKFYPIDGEILGVKSFDEKEKKLEIFTDSEIKEQILNHTIVLYSDLKFLVMNVEKFFQKHADNLPSLFDSERLEAIFSLQSEYNFQEVSRLSQEQNTALKNLLQSPISYIWGLPGSGKTKGVLFEALKFLLSKEKRTLILAPTNTALEQILYAILPMLAEQKIPLEFVLRLGTPTQNFFLQYGEVCDPGMLTKKFEQNLFTFEFSKTIKQRLQEAKVIALTLDGFIRRYESLGKIDHIFLDEAASVPLIKSLSLAYYDAPLTLLGDHKQLNPVCEANSSDMRQLENGHLLQLFSLSSLYCEDFFKNGEAMLKNPAFEPTFEQINLSVLTRSYRYGENLTQILDHFIYHANLHGLQEATEIFYIDSGTNVIKDREYSSLNEAQSIAVLTQSLKMQDFGIITPFRQQQKLLYSTCTHLRGLERIFTIHKSQGLEFDTIIFSPVLCHYHLTDSRNLRALSALNVAVSRAKKRIILVCDVKEWRKMKNQFITALLNNAKPFKEESCKEFL